MTFYFYTQMQLNLSAYLKFVASVIRKILRLSQNDKTRSSNLDHAPFDVILGKFLNIIEMAKVIHFTFGSEIKLREHYGKM